MSLRYLVHMSDELREPDQPDRPPKLEEDRESPEARRRTLLHLADLRELQERAREVCDRLARIAQQPPPVEPPP